MPTTGNFPRGLFHPQLSPMESPTVASGPEKALPVGWRQTMDLRDQSWVARALFDGRGRLKESLQLWNNPPPTRVPNPGVVPNPDGYFRKRLLLWMPVRMWRVDLQCPRCTDGR